MKLSARTDGLESALKEASATIFNVADEEMKDGGEGLRSDLRQQTEEALGIRVANAWRGRFYANEGAPGGPAAFVWSRAPRIIDFFSASRVITPLGSAFAVPTDNVPRGSRGRRLTPVEVEARFNAELQPVRLKDGTLVLMLELVAGRSTRRPGFRSATARRRAHGRQVQKLLMFVLLRSVSSRQVLDLQATADKWGARIAANIDRKLNF